MNTEASSIDSPTTKVTASTPHSKSSSCCHFIITGFGPFHGVPDNPTSILIRRLREDDDASNNNNIHRYETHILETSAEYVREKIDDIYEQLQQQSSSSSSLASPSPSSSSTKNDPINIQEYETKEKKDIIILLHLGVNYRGKQFQLEQCAYNDATFRIPDERGYKPNHVCILQNNNTNETTMTTTNTAEDVEGESTYDWGQCLKTTLDIPSLCSVLQKESNDNNNINDENGIGVIVSTDPGRFVCNYTYCLSLDRCRSTNKKHYCRGENGAVKDCGGILKQQQHQPQQQPQDHCTAFIFVYYIRHLPFVYPNNIETCVHVP